MTSLGKTLVLLNVALSLGMAASGLILYSNRVDWSNTKDGEIATRVAKLKELGDPQSGALTPAAASWNESRAILAADDARRARNLAWYAKEINFNQLTATKVNPAHALKIDKGQPIPGKPGSNDPFATEPGIDQYGQPLQSLAAYLAAEDSLNQQIDATQKNIEKVIQEDIRLTNQIAGDNAMVKGLHQRIEDERAKTSAAITEALFVRPLLINAVVESDIVLRRQRALASRIKELQKVGVARQ
jgi:hypothetical protein